MERRYYSVELRVEESGQIEGYAAVFNRMSEDLGGFREIVRPGFFGETVKGDVRALFNHDSNYVLGRSPAGTLKLAEDENGLRVVIDAPPTSWADDLRVSMRRGDINQMSFGFAVAKDLWSKDEGYPLRELITAEALYDVSVVTFPAYPQTSAEARAKALEIGTTAGGSQEAPAAGETAELQGQHTRRKNEVKLARTR